MSILTKELKDGLQEIGLLHSDQIYVTGNISKLAKTRLKKEEILLSIDSALFELLGKSGTVFSPSASMNLCNTNITFDPYLTKSYEMGPLSEFLRIKDKSVRSFHPFWSISGNGMNSDVLLNVSRHSYGMFSPWSYFLDMNVRQVNFGIHPSKAVTLIHHIETIFGVPYRYTKEFIHPVLRDNEVVSEPFYMSVLYKESDITKRIKLNEHYFLKMEEEGLINYFKHNSGMEMWAFLMKDFYSVVKNFFLDDIYNYLENPPKIRPYQV